MKRFLGAFLAVLLLMNCLPAIALGEVVYVVNPDHEDRLNLRESATQGSHVIARLYTGTAAEVLETFTEYTKVRIGQTEGYLANSFLSTERKDWDPGIWVVINMPKDGEGLNLRKGPNKGSTSFGLMGNGETVQYLEEEGDYAKVRTMDIDAYLLSDSLAQNDDEAKPIATELTVGKTETATELRCYPDDEALSLGSVPQGTVLAVLDVIGLWYYVEASGSSFPAGATQRGFVHHRALRVGNYVEGSSSSDVFAVVKTGKDSIRLPMRASPGMSSNVLATLVNTAQVQLVNGLPNPGDTWWHVRADGQEGYILSEYMQLVESGPPSGWQ